jgi:hypothetical protein
MIVSIIHVAAKQSTRGLFWLTSYIYFLVQYFLLVLYRFSIPGWVTHLMMPSKPKSSLDFAIVLDSDMELDGEDTDENIRRRILKFLQ